MAERDNPEDAEGVVGAATVGAGGAILGAIMGAAAGPIGIAVGTAVGTLAGAAIGYAVDYGAFEKDIRQHHESDPAQARHTWDEANPAYRYGWAMYDRPEFRDKTYDQARPELHKGWTGSGDFADYEPYVKHAWNRRVTIMQDGTRIPAPAPEEQTDFIRGERH